MIGFADFFFSIFANQNINKKKIPNKEIKKKKLNNFVKIKDKNLKMK